MFAKCGARKPPLVDGKSAFGANRTGANYHARCRKLKQIRGFAEMVERDSGWQGGAGGRLCLDPEKNLAVFLAIRLPISIIVSLRRLA